MNSQNVQIGSNNSKILKDFQPHSSFSFPFDSKISQSTFSTTERLVSHYFESFFKVEQLNPPPEKFRISQAEIKFLLEKIKNDIEEALQKSFKSLSPPQDKQLMAQRLSDLLFYNQENKPRIIITEVLPSPPALIKVEEDKQSNDNEDKSDSLSEKSQKCKEFFKLLFPKYKKTNEKSKAFHQSSSSDEEDMQKTQENAQLQYNKKEQKNDKEILQQTVPKFKKAIRKKAGRNEYLKKMLFINKTLPLKNTLDRVCGFIQIDEMMFCECQAENQGLRRFEICLNLYQKLAENQHVDWKVSSCDETLYKKIRELKDYISKSMKKKVIEASKLILKQILNPFYSDKLTYFKKKIEITGEEFSMKHVKRIALIVDTLTCNSIESTKYIIMAIEPIEEVPENFFRK